MLNDQNHNRGILKFWTIARQQQIAIAGCIAMFIGFIASRSLMSVAMVVLFINALHPGTIFRCWQLWRKDIFSISAILFFITYLISGLWSMDKERWLEFTIMKLPFLVLPFSFFSIPLHHRRYLIFLTVSIGIVLCFPVVYGLYSFVENSQFYIDAYKVSHVLPTTKYGDHIRFSQSLAFYVLIGFYFLFEKHPYKISFRLKLLYGFLTVLFIVYLHVLAVKTGLLCLYVILFLFILIKGFASNKIIGLITIVLIPLLLTAVYFLVPTFKAKVNYIEDEIVQMRQGKLDYNFSDAGRIISYKVCAKAVANAPLAGVGAGDVINVMRDGYKINYPEVPTENMLIPHNQFLFSTLAVGLIMVWCLIVMIFAPFFMKVPMRYYLVITVVGLALSLMAEAALEVQFGVFIYLFFVLFWMNLLRNKNGLNSPS